MAISKVKTPDGRTIRVRHKDGATREQIIEFAQRNYQPRQEFSGMQMLKNYPKSALNLVQNMANTVLHPKDTISAVGNLVREGAAAGSAALHGERAETPTADAVVGAAKERYGSVPSFLNTLMNDPAGVQADVSGVTAGAGMMLPRNTALANALKTGGAAIDPINVSANAAKIGVGSVVKESWPRALMESAVKFSTTMTPEDRGRKIGTMLREDLMPTSGGMDKLNNTVQGIFEVYNKVLDDAAASGKSLTRDRLYSEARKLYDEWAGPEFIDSNKRRKVLDGILNEYDRHLDDLGVDALTPQQAQELKKKLYEDINWNASRQQGSKPAEDTYAAVARGARIGLEELDPRIAPLNQRAGDLLDLRDALMRSANRIENRDFIGIDPAMKILPATAIAGEPGAYTAALASILSRPAAKAKAALMLESARNAGPGQMLQNGIRPLMLRQAMLQSGRLEEMQD